MTPFTQYVSRKVLAAVAVFAVVAATLVGFAVARGTDGSSDTATVDLSARAAADFGAALADPAAALEATAGPDDPAAGGDGSGGWRQLRADLRAARSLDGDARRDALAAIRTKAQEGAYGDRIERRADRRQIHRDLFFSLLPDNLQADLTDLKNAPADQRPALRADIMDKALAGDYGPEVQDAATKLKDLREG
jgi:hypothetical protein